MPKVTFYLVRHGEAESNVLNLLSSYPEVPGKTVRHLTLRGEEQARQAGEQLKEEDIDVIISSPLTRTLETANIIGGVIGLPVFQDIRLRETGFGSYNEGSTKDFFQAYTDPGKRLETDGGDGVESTLSMRDRVESLMADIVRELPNQKVVLVSHSDTLEQVHGYLVGEDAATSAQGWWPEKGSVTKLEWEI